MLLETVPKVDVVSPGLLSYQHIETNPKWVPDCEAIFFLMFMRSTSYFINFNFVIYYYGIILFIFVDIIK